MTILLRQFALCVLVISFAGTIVGCGGPKVTEVEVQQSTAVDDIKKGLEGIAESGVIDSSVEDVRNSIGRFGQEDKAKGDELMKDVDELSGLTDSAKIKAKAKEMLGKL